MQSVLQQIPKQFADLMKRVTGQTPQNIARVDDQTIAKIIPDDPQMLYDYVVEFMAPDSPMKSEFLERAARAVLERSYNDRENDVILGDIRLAQGELPEAAEAYKSALIRQPNDPHTRYKRGTILFELERLDEALEEAEYLRIHSEPNPKYNKFLSEVESAIAKRERDKQ